MLWTSPFRDSIRLESNHPKSWILRRMMAASPAGEPQPADGTCVADSLGGRFVVGACRSSWQQRRTKDMTYGFHLDNPHIPRDDTSLPDNGPGLWGQASFIGERTRGRQGEEDMKKGRGVEGERDRVMEV